MSDRTKALLFFGSLALLVMGLMILVYFSPERSIETECAACKAECARVNLEVAWCNTSRCACGTGSVLPERRPLRPGFP